MAERRNAIKTQHALKVLSSLDNLRAWGWICDFEIRVGREIFSVHRTVLAACSTYFQKLFTGNSDEAKQGFVEILAADVRAIRLCIEFMYSGEAVITLENVQHVLPAAGLLQLTDLTELCLNFLRDNVSYDTCLYIRRMCKEYHCEDIGRNVEKYITENMEKVIATEGFRELKKEEILHYLTLQVFEHEVLWQAAISWVKFSPRTRKKDLFELLSPNFTKFPPGFLVDTILKEPLVQQSRPITDMAIVVTFSDVEALKESITVDNCFAIKSLCEGSHIRDRISVHNETKVFLMKNFEAVYVKPEFSSLPYDEVLQIFRSPKTKYSNEMVKWEAALKWVQNSPQREKFFPNLFRLIKLENLPLDFIVDVVKVHRLTRGCDICKECIMDALISRANHSGPVASSSKTNVTMESKRKGRPTGASPVRKVPKKKNETDEQTVPKIVEATPQTYIAVLNSGTGQIKAFDLAEKWRLVTRIKSVQNVSSIVALKGNLYLLDGDKLSCFEGKTWKQLSAMKWKPTKEAKAVAFRDSIHVIDNNRVAWYNPTVNDWVDESPVGPLGDGFCIASNDTFIYILGGSNGPNRGLRYDPADRRVSDIAPMAKPRIRAAAACLGDQVFVMGGISELATNTAEKYDPGTDAWTYIKPMLKARAYFCACAVDEKVYVLGGSATAQDRFDSVEVYQKDKGIYKWRILHQMMKMEPPFSAAVISARLPPM